MEQTAFLVRRDESHSGWERAMRSSDFEIGQRVRIARGPLAGLRGTVASQTQDGKWVLELSDTQRGVLICLSARQIAAA